MAKEKPEYRIMFKQKDAPKGTKSVELGAAWKNQFGNHNFNFPRGTKIRLPDGQVIDCDKMWFTMYKNEPKEKKADDLWSTSPVDQGDGLGEPRSSWDVTDGAVKQLPQQQEFSAFPVQHPPEEKDDDIPF